MESSAIPRVATLTGMAYPFIIPGRRVCENLFWHKRWNKAFKIVALY